MVVSFNSHHRVCICLNFQTSVNSELGNSTGREATRLPRVFYRLIDRERTGMGTEGIKCFCSSLCAQSCAGGRRMEAGGQYLTSSPFAVHLIAFRDLSLNLELTNSVRLAGQGVPRSAWLCFLMAGVTGRLLHPASVWVLEI